MKQIVAAGIDGGSSSTRCIAIDTGCWRLVTHRSGPSNILSAGPETTLYSIREALDGALKKLGKDRADVAALCLSGAWTARRKLNRIIDRKINAKKIIIKSDVEAAAVAGLGSEKRGIVVISGTGSIVVGLSGGSFFRAGGWGHVCDDEGSAYDISIKALRMAFQSYDGRGMRTSLEGKARSFFRVNSMEGLARYIHEIGKERMALFAEVVKSEAEKGDKVARSIVEDAAASLSSGVMAIAKRMGIKSNGALNVYLVGGMFMGDSQILRREMIKRLSLKYRKLSVKKPTYPPTVGALMIALREIGEEVPEEVLKNASREISRVW